MICIYTLDALFLFSILIQLSFNKYSQPNRFGEQNSDSSRDETNQYPINENKKINYKNSLYNRKSKANEINK